MSESDPDAYTRLADAYAVARFVSYELANFIVNAVTVVFMVFGAVLFVLYTVTVAVLLYRRVTT